MDAVIGTWIDWQREGIRHEDPSALCTVGYNTVYVAWPANARLDFIANHTYENLHAPTCYDTIVTNVTTMDRLRALWPDKPILIGEFGYSGGNKTRYGRLLSVHDTAVAEMIHYLYAFARGYSGVIKWMCCDWPVPVLRRQATWIPREDTDRQLVEGRLGLYWYDGTPEGHPKPLCYALRFLRDYVDAGNTGGRMEIRRSKAPIGTGYVYRNRNALFVGDVEYAGDGLRFRCADGGPANVMLAWERRALTMMATADVVAIARPARLDSSLRGRPRVSGTHGGMRLLGDAAHVTLLEGETLRLSYP